MLDTIALTLNYNEYRVVEHERFTPSTRGLYEPPYYQLGKKSYVKCIQNPPKEDLKKGLYRPRLTITRRRGNGGCMTDLRVEFSAPKLLFGNNFDELTDKDYPAVLRTLRATLHDMGVIVFGSILENTNVSAIHYSKNIALTDYSTPYPMLRELSKMDLNAKLDLNQTDFRNEGHSVKYRANSYEVTFYDKLKDLQKAKISPKRSVEAQNEIQLDLFKNMDIKKPFEVVRMEVRLGKRAKIAQLLRKCEILRPMTFKELFSQDVSQAILQHHYREVAVNCSILPHKPENWKTFAYDFREQNPTTKASKMLQLAGAIALSDEIGIRELREVLRPFGEHNWRRLKTAVQSHFPTCGPPSAFRLVEQGLKNFKPLKLNDYLS